MKKIVFYFSNDHKLITTPDRVQIATKAILPGLSSPYEGDGTQIVVNWDNVSFYKVFEDKADDNE